MNGGKRQWKLTFHPGLPALAGTFYDSLLTAPWLLGEGRETAISCGFVQSLRDGVVMIHQGKCKTMHVCRQDWQVSFKSQVKKLSL